MNKKRARENDDDDPEFNLDIFDENTKKPDETIAERAERNFGKFGLGRAFEKRLKVAQLRADKKYGPLNSLDMRDNKRVQEFLRKKGEDAVRKEGMNPVQNLLINDLNGGSKRRGRRSTKRSTKGGRSTKRNTKGRRSTRKRTRRSRRSRK
jgi:hypothetical protein